MLNKKFTGIVKSVSVISKTSKLEDGTKIKNIYHQVKLESADIDYESMNDFNINIAQSLLAIQPMPFDSITYPKQKVPNLMINLRQKMEDESMTYAGIDLIDVEIEKLIVVVKENIPTYCFILHIPFEKNPNSKYISELYKMINEFEFSVKEED